jgi:thymidylate synthase (FAD)
MLFRQVRLISATPDAEQTIAYCARVSSPKQESDEWAPLLAYCIRNHHWSIFEMANMVVEITTSRAIAQQILRHRSFSFQEFSQRYAAASDFYVYEARRQDTKNRQNSIDDLSQEDRLWFSTVQVDHGEAGFKLYQEALERGIAKECARFLLPLSTETKLYMNGTLRSWIHYLQLRTTPGTQLEHLEIAEEIKLVFAEQFPAIAEALEW